ncbi:MAG: iron ABC transporter permease [Desulfosoma sp.]
MSPWIRRAVVFAFPWPVIVLSVFVGPQESISPRDALGWMASAVVQGPPADNVDFVRAIVWDIRIPRILLAFCVGGALAASGAALQAVFRNPLVSPYILGISSGAAFGAAAALAVGFLPVYGSAFLFGMAAVGCSYTLGRVNKAATPVSLVLSGMIVSGIFTALLTIVQFLADPFRLQTIVHWTMGNLHNAEWRRVLESAPIMAIGGAGMFFLRWRMNILALGDQEAYAVGVNPEREKIKMLIPATLAASAAVAAAGIIGMVGLVVPHMVRMMLGPDNRVGIPACFLFGGAFLVLVDDFSRALTAFELPIGIFTTLIGGPFFIFLLRRSRLGWAS